MTKQEKSLKETLATYIRILTAPPFMIAFLLYIFDYSLTDIFLDVDDCFISWLGLVILPLLAYPVHKLIPALNKTEREGQRRTAFIFSLVGYFLCYIYSFFTVSVKLKFVFSVYLFTVIFLTVMNKVLHIRASGHSASAVSPCVFSFLYVGILFGVMFLLLFCGSVWSSICLKRHSWKEIIAGAVSFILALIISALIMGV